MKQLAIKNVVARVLLVLVYLFILAPLIVTAIYSFNGSRFMSFPMREIGLQWYGSVLTNPEVLAALGNSVVVALGVATTAVVFGFLGAYGLVRWKTRATPVLSAFFASPLAVPWLFLGLGLLLFFGFVGLPKSLFAVYVGHSVFAVPMAILIIRSSLEKIALSLEEAALDLGCKPFRTIFTILAPSVRPSLIAAFLISFTLSFDEFIMAWFVSGFDITLPVYIWSKVKSGMSPEINVIGVLVFTFSIVLGLIAQRIVTKRQFSD